MVDIRIGQDHLLTPDAVSGPVPGTSSVVDMAVAPRNGRSTGALATITRSAGRCPGGAAAADHLLGCPGAIPGGGQRIQRYPREISHAMMPFAIALA